MKFDCATWPTLSKLLDEWLDLPEDRRATWLESLGPEYAGVQPVLRQLLAAHANAGDNFLQTLPRLDEAPGSRETGFRPGMRIGPYQLARQLGQGGMGEVWQADRADDSLRRTVALKLPILSLPRAGLSERFARERDILAQLAHPHIARLYDAGIDFGGQPYLALEYVDGESITSYCDRKGLCVHARLALFLDVLRAVQYAHSNLVVHRDLKPSNILVTKDGEVRLLDFGIAKLLTEGEAKETELTRLGGRVLTPEYASPEQITGEPITTASDVYSLGVILYELLTGARPYRLKHESRGSVEEATISADPIRPSLAVKDEQKARARASTAKKLARSLKSELDTVVLKALQKQPQQRYATADAFAQDIERYLKGEAVLARPESAWYRARKFVLRNKLAVASAAAAVAALSIGLGIALWQTHIAILERQRADTQAATAQAVNDFLQNDLLAQASPNNAGPSDKPDRDLKVRTALDRAAAHIAGKFDKQPLVEASIRQTISRAYQDLGLYAEAQRQVERAIELQRRIAGKSHRDTLASMYRLAELYSFQGKYADAEKLDTEVLAAQTRTLGEEDRDSIYTMASLAEAQWSQRKLAQAEALYLKALNLARRKLGEEHPETLTIMNDLGLVYANERKYPDTFAILTKTLQIRRRVSGDDHPLTMETTYNLGTISLYFGKYSEAWPLLTKAHEVCLRVLGEEHLDCLRSTSALGTFYLTVGKYKQAEEVYSRLVELERRVLGKEHPDTLRSLVMLGQVDASAGKYAEAERLLNYILTTQEGALGKEHPIILRAWINLAYAYACQGRDEQAAQMYRQALEIQPRVLGEDYSDTLDSMNYLGQIYQRQGNYAEAERLLAKALELRRRVVAPENVFLADNQRALGQLRLDQRNYAGAEALLRDALASYEKAGSDSWLRYQTSVLLGASLVGQGRYREAEPLLSTGRRGMLERKATIPLYGRPALERATRN